MKARVLWTLGVAGAGAVACGARTPLLVPDGGECLGTFVPVDVENPVLYFLLDHSGSMAEMDKWPNMRSVIAELMTELGPRARFGAAMFPAQSTSDECATGAEVMPVQLGDSQGTAAGVFLAATSLAPTGGTPTAATVEALTPELASFPELTFAILATDGGPNCDAALSCDASTCTSNMDNTPNCPTGGPPNCCDPTTGIGGLGCLDGARTAAAVTSLQAAGVRTFVLGIPGSAPYAAVLDSLAQAGGTARATEPYYYSVDTADTTALATGLAQIAQQAAFGCTLLLPQPPPDPAEVNLYVGGNVVPQDGPNGWTVAGSRLTLLGSTCAAVVGTDGMPTQALRVLEGCATVTQ